MPMPVIMLRCAVVCMCMVVVVVVLMGGVCSMVMRTAGRAGVAMFVRVVLMIMVVCMVVPVPVMHMSLRIQCGMQSVVHHFQRHSIQSGEHAGRHAQRNGGFLDGCSRHAVSQQCQPFIQDGSYNVVLIQVGGL